METNINTDKDVNDISIRIQTMTNSFAIKINKNVLVKDLKLKISSLYNIPPQCQRLIFQGKLMQDNSSLNYYKISEDCVVHLVARTLEEVNNSTQNSNQSSRTNLIVNNSQGLLLEEILPATPFSSNRRRGRIMPHFDYSECIESMYQNMISIDNFIKCRKEYNPNSNIIDGFDFSKSEYELGEWVDAKDTIEQWLEAQIIQIDKENRRAYIHYNGWGTRWDEWINFDSPRMQNFKVYTLQSPAAGYNSPYPGIPLDFTLDLCARPIDALYYLEKCRNYMSELIKNIDEIVALRKKKKNKIFTDNYINKDDNSLLYKASQIIPICDRVGKLMGDISLLLSHLLLNPKCYSEMLLGHKIEDLEKELDDIEKLKNSVNNKHIKHNKDKDDSCILKIKNNDDISKDIQKHCHSAPVSPRNISPIEDRFDFQQYSYLSATYLQTNLGYNLSASSIELPFIQRIVYSYTQSDRIISHPSLISKLINYKNIFPYVNLVAPALLCAGEVMMITGYSPFPDTNFDIYLHTMEPSRNNNRNRNNQNNNNNVSNNINNQGNVNAVNNNQIINIYQTESFTINNNI